MNNKKIHYYFIHLQLEHICFNNNNYLLNLIYAFNLIRK